MKLEYPFLFTDAIVYLFALIVIGIKWGILINILSQILLSLIIILKFYIIFKEFSKRTQTVQKEKKWKCLICKEEVNNNEKCKCMREYSHNLNKTNNCQQIKKGEEVTLTTDNHLETRSDAEEDNKKSDKTADVDNQSVDNITGRWSRGYARRSADNHGFTLSEEKK